MFLNQDLGATPSTFYSAGIPMSTSPQYLPEYLLGESSTTTTPAPSHIRSLSVLTPSPWANLSSGQINAQSASNTATSRLVRNTVGEKQGGPPIFGLYDQQSSESPSSFTATTGLAPGFNGNQDCLFASPSKSRDASFITTKALLSQSNVHLSPAQLDPFYTQGESLKPTDELDETWVTVFGFPPSAVGYILQQFAQYGNILQHKMSGGNNWVHIHYQTKIQAKKALAKNGKIFCDNMMVGVQPCIDKSAMKESSKENVCYDSPLSFTPGKSSSVMEHSGSSALTGMRPLTQAYRVAASSHEVLPSSPTLQKKSSAVSKAMEYVFGW